LSLKRINGDRENKEAKKVNTDPKVYMKRIDAQLAAKKKTSKNAEKPKITKYVAVLINKELEDSNEDDKSWSCYVDKNKDVAIKKAIESTKSFGPYDILVGRLEEEVQIQACYALVKL
jgi:hypothetical protein